MRHAEPACLNPGVTSPADTLPDDLDALRAALLAERTARATEQAAREEAEARASGAEAMVAHLKLLIAQLRRERFGASAERGSKLNQLELQLEELEAAASEDATASDAQLLTPLAHPRGAGRIAAPCMRICRAGGSWSRGSRHALAARAR